MQVHCQNPLEVLDDSSLRDITCPSCDSRFNLLADETLTYRADEYPTIGQETLTLKGHTGVVRSVAFSPDGKRIVSGGRDIKVWDASKSAPKPGVAQ